MSISDEELWSKVFGALDPDAVLNEIDQLIEDEEYCDRDEGFLDKVEMVFGDHAKANEITAMAQRLKTFAESNE